jgi:hypothetical protein
MDWYPEILKEAIHDWDGGDKNLHKKCSNAWLNFTWLAALISNGCDRNVQPWAVHGDELDAAGKDI